MLASSNNTTDDDVTTRCPSAAKIGDGFRDGSATPPTSQRRSSDHAPPAREAADQEEDRKTAQAQTPRRTEDRMSVDHRRARQQEEPIELVNRSGSGIEPPKSRMRRCRPCCMAGRASQTSRWPRRSPWALSGPPWKTGAKTHITVRQGRRRPGRARAGARSRAGRGSGSLGACGRRMRALPRRGDGAYLDAGTRAPLRVGRDPGRARGEFRRPPRPGLLLNVVTFGIAAAGVGRRRAR